MDWNNDGKKDLLAGDSSGKVWLFQNTGTDKTPVLSEGTLLSAAGKPIVGVPPKFEQGSDGQYQIVPNKKDVMGVYSKIHFADFDGDGLKDLLVGQDGPANQHLVWYKNIGTANAPVFDKPVEIKLPLSGIGRPSPYVIDWDGDGKPDLLLGSESAQVYFCRNAGTKQKPEFTESKPISLKGKGFEAGYRCRIDVADWNNDGKLDILVGNFYPTGNDSGGNIWLFLGK